MTEIPRRTIEEMMFIYERDPDRRDVYVEGAFDSAILQWLIQYCGLTFMAAYEIGTIDIPDGDIINAGRKANNRERVIFLAEYFDKRLKNGSKQITCFVDADSSHLVGDFSNATCLIYTDFSCMEMYFFNQLTISKLITIQCNRSQWPIQAILTSLESVLQELFLYRFANETLNWSMDWLDDVVCMNLIDWSISLDFNDYIMRFLNKNSRARDFNIFINKIETLRSLTREDARYQMHGHDFTTLLCWIFRQKGIKGELCKVKVVERSLALAADFEEIKNHNAFKQLVCRASS